MVIVGAIIHLIYLVLGLDFNKSFSEQALFICHIGSLSASFTIVALVSKIRLSFIDYTSLFIIIVRIIETFLILHLIEQHSPGFTLIDKKELSDSIQFVASPALILAICNFKFNLFLVLPMVLVFSVIAIQRTLTVQGENLACFVNPEGYANSMSGRWVLQLLTMKLVAYMYRKSTLERHIE